MIFVKICGITSVQDAVDAVEAGADAIGFNFYPKSSRYLEPEVATLIAEELPDSIMKVGVFVDAQPEWVRAVSQDVALDILQFHGDETPYYCEQFASPYWKAFRLQNEKTIRLMEKYQPESYLVDAFSIDQYGGTGELADWELAKQAKEAGQLILAGGLDADNISEAITEVDPWGVDVCSGVEDEPGVKNRDKMFQFLERAKEKLD